ncbi:hypothetical protein [Ensifer aridi]|uniref:hypothetical protein n=1 Tax=Ensifer aridi TaxID=1708715 RepID=UPI00047D2D15|nr:hypothetical protein [Ensifer aridi]
MGKLNRLTAGKLLDRMVRVSVTADKVGFGALGPPASSISAASAAFTPVDDRPDRRVLNAVRQTLSTGEDRGSSGVVQGSIRP